jgi:hypothetical protein
LSVAVIVLFTGPASSQEEPFGSGFDGWKFTQQGNRDGSVNCRAILGENLMSRSTNGKTYVSTRSTGVAKGNYPDSTVIVGGNAEMVDAASGGVRLLFYIDEYTLEQIAINRGYAWRLVTGGGQAKTGTVNFNNSATSALERVLECNAANGG